MFPSVSRTCLGVRPHLDATFNFSCRIKCFTARLSHRLCNASDECVCGGREIGVGVCPPPLLPSLFSLSSSPHGGDTTVPSALHLFNKDLLCSETLIRSVRTHAETHTSRLLFFFFFRHRLQKKKKSEGCGIGNAWRALCQLSLQQEEEEPAGTQRQGCQLRPRLPSCHTRTHRHRYNYKLVTHVFMVRCEQREI